MDRPSYRKGALGKLLIFGNIVLDDSTQEEIQTCQLNILSFIVVHVNGRTACVAKLY